MKTLLYNPIFINPQAYYVFPRLTRYLQPDNESTSEPANYIGTIEVKVIAYGDTTLKRTYTNTDSIDLSEFKNTWIRISLFTKVGSCVLGEWKIGNMESDLPYIDPEVLASLKAVVIVGNKTNNDSDRAIVKNLVDPDNPFVISNAAYTEGSGYADKDSPYYGAFVTDGIDDLITSAKTVQEMGITDEITVVSMIHKISSDNNWTNLIGELKGDHTFVAKKGAVDEVTQVTGGGVPLELKSNIGNRFTFDGTLSNISPQKINITIDEYIRYEDIVQPYPILLRFNDENGNEVSWGGKFKVGSTITRIGSIDDPERNLLNGLYSVSGLSLNGKAVTSSTSIVEKQMVFKTTTTYLLDNNEPKCILSPSRLRIPNSSYKLLGYIPDISGHGNHGVIHNSAYAEGSGVNEDGSYQLDGVDDHITIPTLSSGGKQVLMKVNLPRLNSIIYDQRKETNTYTFAILTTPSGIAYDQRNSERITYIDGILNTNIIAEQLMGVTHNIVVINSKANLDNTRSPILGRDINGNNWSRMRIYDFMIFDEISTDDKIKELNEYVGIEGNTEWRKTE